MATHISCRSTEDPDRLWAMSRPQGRKLRAPSHLIMPTSRPSTLVYAPSFDVRVHFRVASYGEPITFPRASWPPPSSLGHSDLTTREGGLKLILKKQLWLDSVGAGTAEGLPYPGFPQQSIPSRPPHWLKSHSTVPHPVRFGPSSEP